MKLANWWLKLPGSTLSTVPHGSVIRAVVAGVREQLRARGIRNSSASKGSAQSHFRDLVGST